MPPSSGRRSSHLRRMWGRSLKSLSNHPFIVEIVSLCKISGLEGFCNEFNASFQLRVPTTALTIISNTSGRSFQSMYPLPRFFTTPSSCFSDTGFSTASTETREAEGDEEEVEEEDGGDADGSEAAPAAEAAREGEDEDEDEQGGEEEDDDDDEAVASGW